MRLQFWAADTFRFSVTGPGVHNFLNHAAAAGVRLRSVRWQQGGYTAAACGPDRRRLEEIAQSGGWTFAIVARHGPGRRIEQLLRCRPGLAVGTVVFAMLLRFLGGFVWCVDFGAMDADIRPAVRQLLADCGIQEGARLTAPLLQTAQAQALRHSETFGWISLNFTGGCLSIESTPAQTQTVREAPPQRGLYAKADGTVTAVELESGFPLVEVGQAVTAGQPIAAAEKLDRKGSAVPQGAGGRILARVQKQYTARQPWETEPNLFTGRSSVQTVLYLPGFCYEMESDAPLTGQPQTEWLPLKLGRLPLPACVCRTTTWEQTAAPLTYPEEAAAALALRTCRARLLEEFPDAKIEAEQREISTAEGESCAAVTYIFTADIARTP